MCKKSVCVSLLLLAAGLAQARDIAWQKAVYYDARYTTGWQGDSSATRTGLVAAGYKLLNADELKTWMNARIADKAFSVVVMCQDNCPDTVCEANTNTCTLRKYLDAGGKVVWYGDIPFYNQSNNKGVNTNWANNGAPGILGFDTSSAPRDSGNTATITPLGKTWGLTTTWTTQRPAALAVLLPADVLAVDNAGNACAWVKHYVAGDTFRGFVRFRDTGGQAVLGDIISVAEYVAVKASSPTPANGATGVGMGLLQWSAGPFVLWHDVYLGTSPELTAADKVAHQMYMVSMYFVMQGLKPGTTYYWRVDEVDSDGSIYQGDVWSFTAAPTSAYDPQPRNGDKWIDPNSDLTWQGGQNAVKHDVYASTDKAAVENRDAAAKKASGTPAISFDLGTMAAGTTYYWAVDETDMTGNKVPGAVWSFTTNAPGGGVKGEYFNGMVPTGKPGLVRTDSAINFNWGDPGGPGAPIGVDQFSARWTADLEVAIDDTYTFIVSTDDGGRLWLDDKLIVDTWVDQGPADHPSTPIHLVPGIYSLKMEYYENGGGAAAQLFWSSTTMARQIIPAGPLQLPLTAKAVYPANGDVNVPQDTVLTYTAGEKAAQHAVYFGTDKDTVATATTPSATQGKDELSFNPGALDWNTTYYWRVDEVNDSDAASPWKGAVWSFTTADSIVVDNMESYNDDDNRIYDTWLDNFGDDSGSTVGNDPAPFAEQKIVHNGKQSLPLAYNNAGPTHLFSQTVRTFDTPQNWTVQGVTDLSLWLRGNPVRFVDKGNNAFTVSGSGTDIWNNADSFRFVYKTLNGNGSVVVKVDSLVNTNVWAKAGVMIRETLDAGSTMAYMIQSPGSGVSFGWRQTAAGTCGSATVAGVLAPQWVKLTRTGNAFTVQYSADGKTWTDIKDATTGAPVSTSIMMGANVYVGLCVTSHDAALTTTAQLSGAAVTGNVSGTWQETWIGTDPDRTNAAAGVYVTVKDSSGKAATVVASADATVANWTRATMPLSSFTGVNMAKVKELALSVGDPRNPVAGGTGKIYLDDIEVTKP